MKLVWPIPYEEIPLFDGIEEKDVKSLLGCLKSREQHYSKGEFILLDQDQVKNVGVVLSGSVHMIKEDEQGHRTMLAYMGKGEVFGENFAFRREQDSFVSFYAATAARILFLSLEHMLNPCKSNCPFHLQLARNLFHLMGEKSQRLMEKIDISAKSSLREKIIAYLDLQAQRQGTKYIKIPLNRTEMASFLQSNRSAMTRELAQMKDEGLIDYDGNTFLLKYK